MNFDKFGRFGKAVITATAIISISAPVAVLARDGGRDNESADISETSRPQSSETPEMQVDRVETRDDGGSDNTDNRTASSSVPRSSQFRINVPKGLEGEASKVGKADSHITEVNVASDSKDVEIQIEQPAKLFGLFPVQYHMAVKVNPTGKTITFTRPWWLFLATDNADKIASAVSNQEQNLTSTSNLGQLISKLGQLIKSLTQ